MHFLPERVALVEYKTPFIALFGKYIDCQIVLYVVTCNLAHRSLNEMANILQTKFFRCIFRKFCIFIKISRDFATTNWQ